MKKRKVRNSQFFCSFENVVVVVGVLLGRFKPRLSRLGLGHHVVSTVVVEHVVRSRGPRKNLPTVL